MNNISKTILSPLLAQAKLLGASISTSTISEVPTFHTPTIGLPEVTAEMRVTLSRLSAEACKKELLSDESRSVLRNANKYGIGYIHGIQYTDVWDSFADQVYKWEDLLEVALDLNIDWSESNYDPVAQEQEIENAHHEGYLQANTMRSEYCADLV